MTDSDLLTDSATIESAYCNELAVANNPFELEQRIKKIVGRLNFSDYAFTRVNVFTENDVIFVTNPAEQLDIYRQEQLYERDLLLAYAKKNTRPVFLSHLYERYYKLLAEMELPSRKNDVYDLNKRFGYFDYYCIPAAACNGRGKVLLALSRRGVSPTELQHLVARQKTALQPLCKAIDYVATAKFPGLFIPQGERQSIRINPLALLVLATLADNDLTLPQVAEKLCISVANANRHLGAAKRALGVRTDYAAIKQAVQAGLVCYS